MTVFITGATAGFGLATAKRLHQDGAKVIGTGRRTERLDKLGKELGTNFLPLPFDVGNREEVIKQMAENEIDLVIMGRPPRELDTIAAPFAKHPLVIIAATVSMRGIGGSSTNASSTGVRWLSISERAMGSSGNACRPGGYSAQSRGLRTARPPLLSTCV